MWLRRKVGETPPMVLSGVAYTLPNELLAVFNTVYIGFPYNVGCHSGICRGGACMVSRVHLEEYTQLHLKS